LTCSDTHTKEKKRPINLGEKLHLEKIREKGKKRKSSLVGEMGEKRVDFSFLHSSQNKGATKEEEGGGKKKKIRPFVFWREGKKSSESS